MTKPVWYRVTKRYRDTPDDNWDAAFPAREAIRVVGRAFPPSLHASVLDGTIQRLELLSDTEKVYLDFIEVTEGVDEEE